MLNIGQNRTSIIENLEIKGEQRIGRNQISHDNDFVTMFTVKPIVRLRATLQYCHAMLVF